MVRNSEVAQLTLLVALSLSCGEKSQSAVESSRAAVSASASAAPVVPESSPSSAAPSASANAGVVSVDEVQRRLDEVLKQSRERVCDRPIIHGPETPGRADADIVGLLEQEVDDASLPAAVRRAVSHRDACSPYLLGRRQPPQTATVEKLLEFGKRLPKTTEQFASSADALAWVVDAFRLGQDLGRGGSLALPAAIGASWAKDLVASSHELLKREDWSTPQLDVVASELDALAASGWAHPAEVVKSEGWFMVANVMQAFELSPTSDPTRELPGLKEMPQEIRKQWRTSPPGQEGDVILRGALRMMAEDEAACPANSVPLSCASGMDALAERRHADSDRIAKALGATLVTPIPVARGTAEERDMQDLFIAPSRFNWRFVKLLIETPIRFAALRLHVEQRRTGLCPTQSDELAKGLELQPGTRGLEVWPPAGFPEEMFPTRGSVLARPLVTLPCGATP